MWQPGIIGTTAAWFVVALLLAFALSGPLTDAAIAAGYCRYQGGTALLCDEPVRQIVGGASLPLLFIGALATPFTYRVEADEHGYGIAFMLLFSPPSFALAALFANYWIWWARRLLRWNAHQA